MKIQSIHTFLLHSLSVISSSAKKVLSVVTSIALSILKRSASALTFTHVNGRNRQIKPINGNSKINKSTASILQSPPSQPHPAPHTSINKENIILAVDQIKVDQIKQKLADQLKQFEAWAQTKQWQKIHRAHYDWWMFPVSKPSAGYGETYAVGKGEIEALKADPAFMNSYKRGVALVVEAWGWDLDKEQVIPTANQANGQMWTGYGVRLAKMSDSLVLFGENELHKKLQVFFTQHCLPQQNSIPISNLSWLKQTLLGR